MEAGVVWTAILLIVENNIVKDSCSKHSIKFLNNLFRLKYEEICDIRVTDDLANFADNTYNILKHFLAFLSIFKYF